MAVSAEARKAMSRAAKRRWARVKRSQTRVVRTYKPKSTRHDVATAKAHLNAAKRILMKLASS
jgi:hypothetical protein